MTKFELVDKLNKIALQSSHYSAPSRICDLLIELIENEVLVVNQDKLSQLPVKPHTNGRADDEC